MTRALAVDLGKDGIRCYGRTRPSQRMARNRLHPVGRVGRPTGVGDLAMFLAGDRSSFLTGEIVVLDGGRTAKLPLPF